MTEALNTKVRRAIYRTLQKCGVQGDLVNLSERLGDNIELVIDMELEPSGIAAVPREMQPDPAWDIQRNEPELQRPRLDIPQARESVVRPPAAEPPKKRVVLMPGDKGFDEPVKLPGKRTVISAVEVMRRPPRRPGANIQERQYWDEPTLVKVINEEAPTEIPVEVEGPEGRLIRFKAVRNVINQQGTGQVLLTYQHPGFTDLVARWLFSLYEKEVDIDRAIDGPKGIMEQLRVLYQVRPESMEAKSGPEPMALHRQLASANPMSDDVEFVMEPGFNPGGSVERTPDGKFIPRTGQVYQQSCERVRQANDALAPEGRRV